MVHFQILLLRGQMHYTETVYKHKDGEGMCRILESIVMTINSESFEGVLFVDTNGNKVAMKKVEFQSDYVIFDVGESPAASIEIGGKTDGNV